VFDLKFLLKIVFFSQMNLFFFIHIQIGKFVTYAINDSKLSIVQGVGLFSFNLIISGTNVRIMGVGGSSVIFVSF